MLTLVSTPIGNLEDISHRALRALADADVVVAEDTRVAKKLLKLLGERFGIEPGAKRFFSFHEHNQRDFLERLEPSFFDQNVVYVSDAGMPSLSDPGAALVRYAQQHSISYEVLPGPNAALTAWVASGYEGPFTFWGFLPHKKEREEQLGRILSHTTHTILYEAPHRLLKLLDQIAAKDPERELFLAKELTKMHERHYKGSAKELAKTLGAEPVKGEWVVIVTPAKKEVLNLDLAPLYELDLPPKAKAKLIAKLTGEDPKAIYQKLIQS